MSEPTRGRRPLAGASPELRGCKSRKREYSVSQVFRESRGGQRGAEHTPGVTDARTTPGRLVKHCSERRSVRTSTAHASASCPSTHTPSHFAVSNFAIAV